MDTVRAKLLTVSSPKVTINEDTTATGNVLDNAVDSEGDAISAVMSPTSPRARAT